MDEPSVKPPVITLIGAGSRNFSFGMCTDICQTPALAGADIRMVDVNGTRLAAMEKLFKKVSASTGSNLSISSTTDRRAALGGTDFVILAAAVDRINRWSADLALSRKYGIIETQGECGGPGGLSLTLRNIPFVLDIARDIEALAPHALLLNFSNPLTRVCTAVNRYTQIQCIGLCHGLLGVQNVLHKILGREVKAVGFGINHFNWIFDATGVDSGESAWDSVRQAFAKDTDPDLTYTRELFGIFGRIVCPGDGHIADFIHHWRGSNDGLNPRYPLKPKDMASYRDDEADWEKRIARYLQGEGDPMADVKGLSGEGAIPIIATMSGLMPAYDEIAVNIPNRGSIANIAEDAVVEVPGRITQGGVTGHRMGSLPSALRSLVSRQLDIAELAVEAAAEGNYDKALQTLAIDPLVPDLKVARNYLDDVLETHRDLLPQFS